MKEKISKKDANRKIEEFFEKEIFDANEIIKIKKLAMKFNIKLGNYRKRFCKKCFSDLKSDGVKIKKGVKTVKCKSCGFISRWKIKIS